MKTVVFCLSLLMAYLGKGDGIVIKVVAMYGKSTSENDLYKTIMRDAVTYINNGGDQGRSILPPNTEINVIHSNVLDDRDYNDQNIFKSIFQICDALKNMEAMALVLPNDFCEDCEMVGQIVGDAYSPVLTLEQADQSGAFQMRPPLDDMEDMLSTVIDHFKWKTFIILYEGRTAIRFVEKMMAKATHYGWRVTPVELQDDYVAQTKALRQRRVKNILVYLTNEDLLKKVVKESFEHDLMSNGWHWMFGNLNPPITKAFLEQKYRHDMAFLTRFKMAANELAYHFTTEEVIKRWPFRQRAAYDSLVAIAYAMTAHYQDLGRFPQAIRTCGEGVRSTLTQYMKEVHFHGASGIVSFNEEGQRVNYTIMMYSGKDQSAETEAGFFVQDIRSWEQTHSEAWPGRKNQRMYIRPFRQADVRFIKVLAVPEPPFFMQKNWESIRYKVYNEDNYDDNGEQRYDDPYTGMSYELLKKVKKVLEEEMDVNFEMQIELQSRGQYGFLDLSNDEWDGMIRDLKDGRADVAIGALVRNEDREEVVDFTEAWFESNVKLLILHPSWTFEYPFALVYPIDIWAWFSLIIMFLAVSSVVYLFAKYSPYEWRKRAKRGTATEEDGQTFSYRNSLFFILSTGFWQSYSKGPRSWSVRVMTLFWFWIIICVLFLFVFSLNGVMKFSKTAINVKDQYDLLHQDQFDFGLVRNSPAYDFFRYNKGSYREVFDRVLNSNQKLMEDRIENAVYRIRRTWAGRYTLLGEENVLKYAAERKPCRMYLAGKSLGNVTLAFATQAGSPLRDQISYAIRLLEERGEIQKIREMEFSKELKCARETVWERQSKYSFTVHDLQGMYYMLFIGMSGSLIVFILEWIVYNIFIAPSTSWKTKMPKTRDEDFLGVGNAGGKDAVQTSADWI